MYSELYAIKLCPSLPSDERELPILGSDGGLGAGAPARLQGYRVQMSVDDRSEGGEERLL